MRTFFRWSLALVVTGLVGGCTASGTGSAAPADTQAEKAADTKVCMMQSGGIDVLKLTIPTDIRPKAGDGSLDLDGPHYEVEFWLVRGAKTVDEAVERVGPQIVDQFKNFKPEHVTDMTVAGSPAKQLIGTGEEADDGDPGEADVIVFKVGDHVFVACNHGEGLSPAGKQGLLTLVQTAQRP